MIHASKTLTTYESNSSIAVAAGFGSRALRHSASATERHHAARSRSTRCNQSRAWAARTKWSRISPRLRRSRLGGCRSGASPAASTPVVALSLGDRGGRDPTLATTMSACLGVIRATTPHHPPLHPPHSHRVVERLAIGKRGHRLMQLQRPAAPHLPPHRDAGAGTLGRNSVGQKKPAYAASERRVASVPYTRCALAGAVLRSTANPPS